MGQRWHHRHRLGVAALPASPHPTSPARRHYPRQRQQQYPNHARQWHHHPMPAQRRNAPQIQALKAAANCAAWPADHPSRLATSASHNEPSKYPRNGAGIGAWGIAALDRQCCADELSRCNGRESHRQAGRRIRRRQHVARRGRLLDWRPPWPSTLLAVRHHPRLLPGSTRMERLSHWAASSVRYLPSQRSA